MAYRQPARPARRRLSRIVVAGVLVVLAAVVAVVHTRFLASSSTAESPLTAPPAQPIGAPGEGTDVLGADQGNADGSALGQADGAVPNGTTVFDGDVPGVAKLDPALLGALRRAATAAAAGGVSLLVDSGWRSRRYQERLLEEAVTKYGSAAEAARWVATPNTSAHVSGEAVDLGPARATAWLSKHGALYGLCQIYGNESWHYELRPDAVRHGCPRMYADPTQDPRMRQ